MYGFYENELFELTLSPTEMAAVSLACQFGEEYFASALGPKAAEVNVMRRLIDIYFDAPDEVIVSWVMQDEQAHGHSEEELVKLRAQFVEQVAEARSTWARLRGQA